MFAFRALAEKMEIQTQGWILSLSNPMVAKAEFGSIYFRVLMQRSDTYTTFVSFPHTHRGSGFRLL